MRTPWAIVNMPHVFQYTSFRFLIKQLSVCQCIVSRRRLLYICQSTKNIFWPQNFFMGSDREPIAHVAETNRR